ncbi:ArsR/SmtB family transcription factor [Megasphaera vaginalis (ex Bordigoni et al. 2020)]|uniref:ArsR/SmtB family transcription factor n=1 Tax=Megasphaera vaginalis (ex Bordigoni et al. 2020) TaxID=2045301 RepID=UPI000C7E0A42|nr:metalloregulator ArsR/SmtB family transcription factor [Megasphaera vaginalis (ex Bordigoni et al. 2020)]
MNAVDAAVICKALGDSNRMTIVQLLTDGELCACDLLAYFRITQPTLSHHMKVLIECNLVRSRKEWKNTYYSLNCETVTAFRNYIESLRCDGKNGRRASSCCSPSRAEEFE